MKIICLGDSLTYGYGVRRSKVWTKLAQDKLGVEIINEGISGDTSGGMLSRFHNCVYEQKPDMVFIMGGVNDLIAGAALGVVKANIMSMVLQSKARHIEPVIGIPVDIQADNINTEWSELADFNKISEEIKTYRQWIFKFCKSFNVRYIDFYEKIKNADDDNIRMDGLHFNERGNEIIAEIFCSEILLKNPQQL